MARSYKQFWATRRLEQERRIQMAQRALERQRRQDPKERHRQLSFGFMKHMRPVRKPTR